MYLETMFMEVPDNALVAAASDCLRVKPRPFQPALYHDFAVPSCVTPGVGQTTYNGYRLGLTSACVDIVLVQHIDGALTVPMVKRAKAPFGNTYWIMGGALHAFRPVNQFILWRAARECGLDPEGLGIDEFVLRYKLDADTQSALGINIIGPLGLYRTPAEDTPEGSACDTLNLCLLGYYNGDRGLYHDRDHAGIRWFRENELRPGACGHWYPEHVGRRALAIMRDAEEVNRQQDKLLTQRP